MRQLALFPPAKQATASTPLQTYALAKLVELHLVCSERQVPYQSPLDQPEKVARLASQLIGNADREKLLVISLNSQLQVNAAEIVAIGALSEAPFNPREVFKGAMLANAAAIVAVHNHPSGRTTPSDLDVRATRRLVRAGLLLGIDVLDHVVVADDMFTSIKSICPEAFKPDLDFLL